MITYAERLRIFNSPDELRRYHAAYQIPTADAVIHFINTFCFTYDPRRVTEKTIPFFLYPKQEEYVRWLWERYRNQEEGAVDKCRTAGFSWVTMAFCVYMLTFQREVSIEVYSKRESDVHVLDNVSSIMEKVNFMIKRLPPAWKSGFTVNHMHIKNAATGGDISGASGDNPGRGGRRSIFIGDEAAFYPRPDLVEAAASETANCKIFGSTHSGTNTLFYRKVNSGAIPVFIFDWWDNPTLDKDWYRKKREKAEAEGTLHIFEREIERNAAASVDAVMIPANWVSSAKEIPITNGQRIAALDVADEGGDVNALVIRDGNGIIYAEERSEGDTMETTIWAFWKAVEFACDEFRFDANGVGAGVRGDSKSIQDATDNEIAKQMRLVPYYSSGKVIRPKDEDYNERRNEEFFENKKAQDYYMLRTMFLNTYRATQEKTHDPDKIISMQKGEMPDVTYNKILREMSQPQIKLSSTGKLMIDKKPKGTKSPNLSDAVSMAFAEVEIEFQSWFFA